MIICSARGAGSWGSQRSGAARCEEGGLAKVFATLLEGVAIVVLAGLGLTDAWRLSRMLRAANDFPDVIGPDRYLGVIAGALGVCGVAYLLLGLKRRRPEQLPGEPAEGVQPRQVAVVAVLLMLYVLAFSVLGYLLATVLFFPVTFFIFGVRPWLKSAWVGILAAACFYVIFFHFAGIPLPKGFLESLF